MRSVISKATALRLLATTKLEKCKNDENDQVTYVGSVVFDDRDWNITVGNDTIIFDTYQQLQLQLPGFEVISASPYYDGYEFDLSLEEI